MGLVSKATRERIRERIDMVQLVSEYVPNLERRGPDDLWGRCPFHEETSPSFHIRPSRGFYKCFGCGKGGDVFRFVEEIEGLSFVEALRRLAARAQVELEASSPEEKARDERRAALLRATGLAAELYAGLLWSQTPAGAKGRAALAARGVTEETARAFRLGVAPEGWTTLVDHARARRIPLGALIEAGLVRERDGRAYDFFRDRLIFPIADEQGRTVGLGGRTLCDDERKYMNSPEVPGVYEKRKVLYGLDLARKARPRRLVVVEGYLDVVVPHQHGRRELVASLGTAFTPEQARLAARYVDEVVLLFDGDEAGRAANQRALAALVGERRLTIRVARLPDGLDPDDLVRRDPAELDRVIDGAEDVIAFLVEEALRGWDRASPAGRERAVRAALRLLARIPDEVLLFTALNRVAERFGLPETLLRAELTKARAEARSEARGGEPRAEGARAGGAGDGRGAAGRGPAGQTAGGERPAARPTGPDPAIAALLAGLEGHLLEALLALPDAAARLGAQGIGPDAFAPGAARAVAEAVFDEAEEAGRVETAAVLGRLDDPAARDLAAALVGRLDPDKAYERELEGAQALLVRAQERRLDEITHAIRAARDPGAKARLLGEHARLKRALDAGRARPVARAR